jgi:uncharacterized phage-associated protein
MQIEKDGRDISLTEMQKLAELFDISMYELIKGKSSKPIKVELPKEPKIPRLAEPEIRISVPQKNIEKIKEVLLYLLEKVGAKPNVGETVIYKLLYFIDFDYYEKFQKQLMGCTYIKNHHGPTPVEFKSIVDKMAQSGEIEIVKSKYYKYDQKKYLPLRKANLNKLTATETAHIDDVIARLSDKNAKDLSEFSHADTPWMVQEIGQPLDYEFVFYRDYRHSVREYDEL